MSAKYLQEGSADTGLVMHHSTVQNPQKDVYGSIGLYISSNFFTLKLCICFFAIEFQYSNFQSIIFNC